MGISQRSDRVRMPVDNILSIKKVASKEEWEKRSVADDVTETKEEEQTKSVVNNHCYKSQNRPLIRNYGKILKDNG